MFKTATHFAAKMQRGVMFGAPLSEDALTCNFNRVAALLCVFADAKPSAFVLPDKLKHDKRKIKHAKKGLAMCINDAQKLDSVYDSETLKLIAEALDCKPKKAWKLILKFKPARRSGGVGA